MRVSTLPSGRGRSEARAATAEESIATVVEYALDRVPSAAVFDQRWLARFQNEVRAAAQLNHPHIVAFLEAGRDDDSYFYTMQLVDGIEAQIHQVFKNLAAVAIAAGGSLADVVKLNVFLIDLGHFPKVNEIMAQYFVEPYPARAAVGVAALPRGALVEADAVMALG